MRQTNELYESALYIVIDVLLDTRAFESHIVDMIDCKTFRKLAKSTV